MKNILILLLILPYLGFAEDSPVDAELYVFGKSYHTNRMVHWHEFNPGLGIGIADHLNDYFDFVACTGFYQDSFGEGANFIQAGIRGILGNREGLHTSLTITMGPYNGSNNNGFMLVPVVAIGYDWIDLCITGDPTQANNSQLQKNPDGTYDKKTVPTRFIAGFLKFRILTF